MKFLDNKNMKETLLYEKLENQKVKCNTCPFRCVVKKGERGICQTRKNIDGKLFLITYGVVSAIHNDPIEKKPLYHFVPGSKTFSVGGYGCNFNCPGCQNWTISQVSDPLENVSQIFMPEDIMELMNKTDTNGLSFTYNEPGIWLEYVIDCFKLAKEQGYYTVLVTNGFITTEALDMLSTVLDAFRVDIKGFSNIAYKNMTSFTALKPVLKAAKYAKKLNMHVECVTNVVPGMNDNINDLTELAKWIKDLLGEYTPWHITAFSPSNKLTNLAYTSVQTLENVYSAGENAGLEYIYIGNVGNHERNNTHCHNCGNMVIERLGFSVNKSNITKGMCNFCNTKIPGVRM